MKAIAILFLTALVANATPVSSDDAALKRRQSGLAAVQEGLTSLLSSAAASFTPPTRKVVRIEPLTPTTKRPGAKRVRVWYGPWKIRAANGTGRTENSYSMDPAGTAFGYMAGPDFPRDITLLNTNAFVMFENGTIADIPFKIYDHHFTFVNLNKTSKQMASCAGANSALFSGFSGPSMTIFMGGSEDKGSTMYSTADGMFDSGLYIGKTDPIYFFGDIVNYNMEERTVYTVGEMEYIEGRPKDFMETGVNIISVGMCDGINTMLQQYSGKKKFSVKGTEMITNSDGYIVGGRGHVHDGGLNIRVTLNGKEVCDSRAIYGPGLGDPHAKDKAGKGEWLTIDRMTQCLEPIKVSKGDKLGMEAHFDLEQHPPRPQHGGSMGETMAIMNLFFATK